MCGCWRDGFFQTDLILLAACFRFVWRKPARGECVGAGWMDFSGGVNFTGCLHPACLCQPAREKCVGADGVDFSGRVSFTGCLHPACLAQNDKRECVRAGKMDFSSGFSFTVRWHPVCLCKSVGSLP